MPESNPNKGMAKDDPRQANEEGDPTASGRSRGHVVDEQHPGGPSRPAADKEGEKSTEKSEHWESGRQRAN